MQDTPETPGTGGPDPAASPTPPPPPPGYNYGFAPGTGPLPGSGGRTKDIVARARDIITQPSREWDVVAAEPPVTGPVLTYVLVLAAIGPIAMVIGQQLFGINLFVINWRPPLAYSLTNAVLGYAMAVAAVYICAFIIDALAPSFGGAKSFPQALKVSAYASTPAFVAGVLNIIPMLGLLVWVASLYGLYLLYLGLPRVMRAPQDKAVGYAVVVILAYIVVVVVLAYIVGAIVLSAFGNPMMPRLG